MWNDRLCCCCFLFCCWWMMVEGDLPFFRGIPPPHTLKNEYDRWQKFQLIFSSFSSFASFSNQFIIFTPYLTLNAVPCHLYLTKVWTLHQSNTVRNWKKPLTRSLDLFLVPWPLFVSFSALKHASDKNDTKALFNLIFCNSYTRTYIHIHLC